MSHSPSDAVERLAERILALEELFTHLQRTVQDLDQAVLAAQKRVEGLERQMIRQADALTALSEPPPPPRDLADERPPHY